MTPLLSKLTAVDVIMFFLILIGGLAFIRHFTAKEEKPKYNVRKPRKDEITRGDILDAKLSSDHEQYQKAAKIHAMYLDEHERALAN